MMKWMIFPAFSLLLLTGNQNNTGWIRVNQLGYLPASVKVAVLCYKDLRGSGGEQNAIRIIPGWQLKESGTNKVVANGDVGISFGAYGPFTDTYRLDFSDFRKPGQYYLQVGDTKSPSFPIGSQVYEGAADFCLRYMRQQRSGFNPFLKDSCHTHDGYTLYAGPAGLADSTHIETAGGWHDASDYLQYSATSANATLHLLMAYRDFPDVFADRKLGNGLGGRNGLADVADEAFWGLEWLLKMNPSPRLMFNQVGDDRDHQGMRIPKEDSFYGKGYERPVYFLDGRPQQRGRFMNNTTGTSSTAGKFASVFALAHYLCVKDPVFAAHSKRKSYYDKALDAFTYASEKPGYTQTVSVRSPYIYAEENWADDIELAAALLHTMLVNNPGSGDHGYYSSLAYGYARQEPVTPWLGADTAKHYQWYPFVNAGHYELAKQLDGKKKDTIVGYYKEGITRIWNRARQNAFYRAIPFIWCSNNLTVAFSEQCYWYRQLSGDRSFSELEQAGFDWLFGCNPWGTSMVYGLPAGGDSPEDPHSAFTHIGQFPIDGGLVDGPVSASIFRNLAGISLYNGDEYSIFQSELAVYHDDYGDYSSNEPTMDGTACLIYLLAAKEAEGRSKAVIFK